MSAGRGQNACPYVRYGELHRRPLSLLFLLFCHLCMWNGQRGRMRPSTNADRYKCSIVDRADAFSTLADY